MIPGTYSLILSLILGAVYPALFIWAVNTLFRVGIPFTFKTYLASLALFLSLRYFLNKDHYHSDRLDDYYGDDEDDDEDYEEEDDDDPDDSTSGGHLRRVK